MPLQDPLARPIADSLLNCLAAQVAELEYPPAQVCLRAGASVEPQLSTTTDECCDGLAWVRHADTVPSSSFPAADEVVSRCGPLGWAVTFELGIVRCAPTPDPTDLITCAQWTDLSYRLMDDDAAMLRAVVCCLAAADTDRRYTVGSYTPLAVAGRCAGGTRTVTVQVDECLCEDEEVMS